MQKLYDLITNKEAVLQSLTEEKEQLSQSMANPRALNDNAQKIQDTERSISLLCDAVELCEETNSQNVSTEEILSDIKDHLEDMVEQAEGENVSNKIRKDIEIINNIINNDLSENEANVSNTQESSSTANPENTPSTSGTGQTTSGQGSSGDTEDIDLPDLGDF